MKYCQIVTKKHGGNAHMVTSGRQKSTLGTEEMDALNVLKKSAERKTFRCGPFLKFSRLYGSYKKHSPTAMVRLCFVLLLLHKEQDGIHMPRGFMDDPEATM